MFYSILNFNSNMDTEKGMTMHLGGKERFPLLKFNMVADCITELCEKHSSD